MDLRVDSRASPTLAPAASERPQPRFSRDASRRRLLAAADAFVAALPGFLLLAKICCLYDLDLASLRHLTVDELPRLVLWALAGVWGLTLVEWLFDAHLLRDGDRIYSRLGLIGGAVAARALVRR